MKVLLYQIFDSRSPARKKRAFDSHNANPIIVGNLGWNKKWRPLTARAKLHTLWRYYLVKEMFISMDPRSEFHKNNSFPSEKCLDIAVRILSLSTQASDPRALCPNCRPALLNWDKIRGHNWKWEKHVSLSNIVDLNKSLQFNIYIYI
jgi:hypothetical protein